MTTTPTQQLAPDHGEPFALPLHYDCESDWGFIREASNALACVVRRPLNEREFAEYRRTGNDPMEPRANRIVACVNACAGMADPAKEIQAMREELADIRQRLKGHPDSKLDGENGLAAATMRGFEALQVENEAMRTAIKQAYRALEVVSDCNLAFDEEMMVNAALDNLFPFLKP